MRDDRVYLELRLSKAIETDENGNWIIEAEASNENLDFDGQVVLQRALLDSKDYFLKNGVISYDHRHLRADSDDPNWSPEKYIIGEPIGVYKKGSKTFVKAKLYKSNPLAQQIVSKLKDGSTRIKTSVGGRQPEIVTEYDYKLGKPVEKIAKVLWDELAITFKPVNQSLAPVALSPAAFVKSLQAGAETDSAAKTGGGALVTEDLERGGKKRKSKAWGVVSGLINGEIGNAEEAERFLINRGSDAEEAKNILRSLLAGRERLRTEVQKMADSELLKAFDESMDTLEKACKNVGKSKDKDEDSDIVAEQGYAEKPPKEAVKAVPPEGEEEEEWEGEPEEEEEEEGEEEEEEEEPPVSKKKLKKSFYDEVREDNEEYLDISAFLSNMTKSLSRRLDALEKKLNSVENLQKALGGGVANTGKLLKSLADVPLPRQAVLNKQQRSFLGSDGKSETMGRAEILEKAQRAVKEGKMSIYDAGVMEERLNKGQPIDEASLRLLKSI